MSAITVVPLPAPGVRPGAGLSTLRLAAMLLRGRAAAGRAVVDALAVATFAISTGLMLSVVAGARAFYERQASPPASLLGALGVPAVDASLMSQWTYLAACAAVLLVVPLLTLSAAAARMGALGRDQRLTALRLLGASSGRAVRLAVAETMGAAFLGAVLGIVLFWAALPVWGLVSFQTAPLRVAEMSLPPLWIAGVAMAVVVLAGIAAAAGLSGVRLSPLGVARRAEAAGVRWQRFIAIPVVLVVWVVVAPRLHLKGGAVVGVIAMLIVLAVFMAVVNLVGPLALQVVGRFLAGRNGSVSLVAGRRLLDDPRGAWRNVSGLAFIGFIGGALATLPQLSTGNPLSVVLAADLRTGALVTLAIAFVTAATSTALNQASAVLDRRAVLVSLDHAGAPRTFLHAVRRREVLVPTLVASIGSAALGVVFFGWLRATSSVPGSAAGPLVLMGILIGGVALVLAASESCRPLVRGVLVGAGQRAE